jgi:hypothetical protein
MLKARLVRFVFIMVLLAGFTTPASGQIVVNFPDANLEAKIRKAIGKPAGTIYDTDLEGITSLNAFRSAISDLRGLEYCTNLTELHLGSNQISDISALVLNIGLDAEDDVDLRENPLSCDSITDHIPALQARGTTVQWTDNDSDKDDVIDACDNCPFFPNPEQDGNRDADILCDEEDPCKFFTNTWPLVIGNPSGIPDECLCGDFDGDGFHSAADVAAINDCAAFIRFDCVSERDEVAEPVDGFYSATDADLVNRVAGFLDPAYTLECGRRPEGTCGGDTGVSCF